jgi:hypothetical protein
LVVNKGSRALGGFPPIEKYLFLWEEKLVVPFIARPNVDKCNRRQTRKATELGYMLHA